MSSFFDGSYGGDGSKIADDTRLECGICWWVYDPAIGDEDNQVRPGTPFSLLPDTWRCPNCDAEKTKFMVLGAVNETARADDPVLRLVNAYRHAAIGMKGMPIYNPTLAVEAVGFREDRGRHVGVIVTPWFMNLTVLPSPEDLAVWVKGETVRLAFPSGYYDFMVSEIEGPGLVGTCSLFSPMSDFTDHEAAQVAAKAAADGLFEAEGNEEDTRPALTRRQLLGG